MSKLKHPVSDLAIFPKHLWIRLGEIVCNNVRKETQSGKDVKGGGFKPYTPAYKKRKASGKIKRSTTSTGKVNLTLTGDMLNALQTHRVEKDGVIVGWASPFNALKVQWNEDEGRDIRKDSGFPFSRTTEAKYDKEFDRFLEKELKKQNETIVFKV